MGWFSSLFCSSKKQPTAEQQQQQQPAQEFQRREHVDGGGGVTGGVVFKHPSPESICGGFPSLMCRVPHLGCTKGR